jgi:hypothetical protein
MLQQSLSSLRDIQLENFGDLKFSIGIPIGTN